MSRYVLIVATPSAAHADPHRVLARLGAKLLDETRDRAFLVEADNAILPNIRAELPGCKIRREVAHRLPGPARARNAAVP